MAREDLLAQLLRTIVKKEGPPPPDDNTLIQKMLAPNDSCSLDDNDDPIMTVLNPNDFVWGGYTQTVSAMGVTQIQYWSPKWKWGQGQWK